MESCVCLGQAAVLEMRLKSRTPRGGDGESSPGLELVRSKISSIGAELSRLRIGLM